MRMNESGQSIVEVGIIIVLIFVCVVAGLGAIDFKDDAEAERGGHCSTFGYEIGFITYNRCCARWVEADLDEGVLYWDNGSAPIATVRRVWSSDGHMCNRGGIRSGNCGIVVYIGGTE